MIVTCNKVENQLYRLRIQGKKQKEKDSIEWLKN
jgi:hypothetical protein